MMDQLDRRHATEAATLWRSHPCVIAEEFGSRGSMECWYQSCERKYYLSFRTCDLWLPTFVERQVSVLEREESFGPVLN